MSIWEILLHAANKCIQETGTGGFAEITLMDEAYSKLVSELGPLVKYTPSNNGLLNLGSIQFFLGDRYVTITRESKYEDYGRTLREAP